MQNWINGGKTNIADVEVNISKNSDGSIQLDRIFIPKNERGMNKVRKAMQKIVMEADKNSITISTNIAPDDVRNSALTDSLRKILLENGFEPIMLDNEVYHNVLERTYCQSGN
jgi:EAL domain-containing protein (putative c-di-GMP-specific phosphodiesterase class I)